MIPSYRAPSAPSVRLEHAKRALVSVGLGLVLVLVASALAPSCTPAQQTIARDALSVIQIGCVVANQALPDSQVAAACGIAEPLIGPMQQALSSIRAASAQAVAGARACGVADAGSPANSDGGAASAKSR
jgi:hypothetical protein